VLEFGASLVRLWVYALLVEPPHSVVQLADPRVADKGKVVAMTVETVQAEAALTVTGDVPRSRK
jgi:hypothetical protein